MLEKRSWGDRLFNTANYIFLALFAIFCLFPFWLMIVSSFTDNLSLEVHGYLPWISKWSTAAYQYVLKGNDIRVGYEVTVFVTSVGTSCSILVMSGLGYVLSLKRFKRRAALAFYVFFPMIFVPGIVPWFIVCRNVLMLKDTIWALILPMMVQPFWVFVLRNFFKTIPDEIVESARMDGASDATILFRIIIPLSMPVLASVALFMAVAYWNDWYLGVMLLDFAPFRPLAVIIFNMVNNIQDLALAMQQPGEAIQLSKLPTLSIRMATAAITIGPIILVYPFIQRYFVKGLMLGAIKG